MRRCSRSGLRGISNSVGRRSGRRWQLRDIELIKAVRHGRLLAFTIVHAPARAEKVCCARGGRLAIAHREVSSGRTAPSSRGALAAHSRSRVIRSSPLRSRARAMMEKHLKRHSVEPHLSATAQILHARSIEKSFTLYSGERKIRDPAAREHAQIVTERYSPV